MSPPRRALGTLYAAAFLRALAVGQSGVLLGIYLARLGLDTRAIGLLVAAGLGGAAAATLVATLAGDRLGTRRLLVALSLLGGAGGLVLALASSLPWLAAACVVGMVNGMGRDRGAALVLEQAVLPAAVGDRERTRAYALYHVAQDAGHALGGLLAGLPVLLRRAEIAELASLRLSFGLYAVLVLLAAPLYLRLGALATPAAAGRRLPSAATRRILWRISALFALDGVGGGFLTTALVALFFHQRFGAGEGTVGLLFALARGLNAISHLAAPALARRIGLVNTMVFTHLPSSLLLVTVAVAPSFPVAAALFLLREGLVEMDVPTRQSYLMAVVRPEERTFATGTTSLVRLAAWAVAPALAGLVMSRSLATPLIIGAALKVTYDLLLWASFRRLRPPEER